jgi:hypothetical protein
MPRQRTRSSNTSLHRRGVSSDDRVQNLESAINHEDISTSVFSAPSTPHADTTSLTYSPLEQLPVEVFNHILSYLVQPRSRLPGLSEEQSTLDPAVQRIIKLDEDLQAPPDTERFAADLFAWTSIRHPFNALAASSKRCCELLESYCAHLVKACNRFNLPFAQADDLGADFVYPSLSSIVYRRLWLQTAPRSCVFCGAFLSNYPHVGFRLLLCCEGCFYSQTLSLDEVKLQYRIIDSNILAANRVRSTGPRYEWILRIDVEALAFRLYGTRAFHDTQSRGLDIPCSIPNCGLAVDLPATSQTPSIRTFPSHVSSAPIRQNPRRNV